MGDREEEQLVFGQRVRKWQSECSIQQREQQSLQPQLFQVLRYAISVFRSEIDTLL